ncbi:Ligand-Gated ion Channel [Aphelenchoides bicaudatus]|nr:Ligand-Gated ion Channel [Aphelenchoides bicaudatus]
MRNSIQAYFLFLLHSLASAIPISIFGNELDISSKSDNEIEYVNPIPSNTDIPSYDTKLEMNVSKILDSLIASHDRRIRPNYGGPATEVNVTAHIITISAVSEVSMDYTIDLYLRQFWHDKRLAFDSLNSDGTTSSLTVGIDMVKSIWVPDTFFPNEKKSFFHETTSHNSFLRIDNLGNVIRSIRLTVTANCPMNLHSFPLDVQLCALEIESYGYSTHDIIYHWAITNPVVIDENVHLAHFAIGPHHHVERVISLSTGNYSRLTTFFTFKRNIGFYLIQIYLPSSLIVVISWVSFWLNREATQARVTIGVTTVLTQTTLMTSTNASLPKVSYVKSLDIFLGVCFFIVFASLLEYAFVGYLLKRQRNSPLSKNSNQILCYYEYEDQPQAQLGPANNNINKRNSFLRRSSKNKPVNNGVEQAMPLLSLSPTASSHGQIAPRLSIVGPAPIAMTSCSTGFFKFHPARVDLFSRFFFPMFFALFHLAYWSFYLNSSS